MRRWTQQRETARAAGKFGSAARRCRPSWSRSCAPTEFLGYDKLDRRRPARSSRCCKDGRPVDAIDAGDEAVVILDRTPFYAESRRPGRRHRRAATRPARASSCATRIKLAGQFHGHVGTLARRHAASAATACSARSTRRAAPRPCSTIPPRTCCTRRCAACSASTSRRRARWSRPTACASTSRISSR